MWGLFVVLAFVLAIGKRLAAHPPTEQLADESLLLACAAGDHAALGLLFDRFQPKIARFVQRYLGGASAEVDDLVQTTFLEALRAAASFRQQSSVQTWLFGIAANVARNHIRANTRRRAFLKRASNEPLPGPDQPELSTVKRQLIERLSTAVPDLPHDLRVVFILCDVEQQPCVDVAKALGLPQGTIWRRLHDARKALRAELDRPVVVPLVRSVELHTQQQETEAS